MEKYPWPGNIREMQGAVRRAMLMATGPTIVPELLPKDILEYMQPDSGVRRAASAASNDEGGAVDLAEFLDDRIVSGSENVYQESLQFMERYLLTRVLRETQGNQSKAALRLGITRGSLRNKMRELGIQVGQVVEPGE
jgi:two-component system nitrogen regulation response regulator GlnG